MTKAKTEVSKAYQIVCALSHATVTQLNVLYTYSMRMDIVEKFRLVLLRSEWMDSLC